MEKLTIKMRNCYGIKSLEYNFDFSTKGTAYAVYAPNGLMKTSFAKTFEKISLGKKPKEERYEQETKCEIEADGNVISKDCIYVLKPNVDIDTDCQAMTDILVDPEKKAKYNELRVNLDKQKNKLLAALQKKSGVAKKDIEQKLYHDFGIHDLPSCIEHAETIDFNGDLEPFVYADIFGKKVIDIINGSNFKEIATRFSKRYHELFDKPGSIYKREIFNPAKAEASSTSLKKYGFFGGGHKVHLKGDENSINETEFDKKLQETNESINNDEKLKQLHLSLKKNAQTQALAELIEKLPPIQVGFFLKEISNQNKFQKKLWGYYILNSTETEAYVEAYMENKDEIMKIEKSATKEAPRWTKAVELFNERFTDMPFKLYIANQTQATLGKEKAKLRFTFDDGKAHKDCSRLEVTTLSHGEERALYLLYFIFDVEKLKSNDQETLFIIDDIADSFDYKNKHAIILYLRDLCNIKNFYQIILTHNFDFFRSVTDVVAHREHCLMANKDKKCVTLSPAEGINNIFINKWKRDIVKNIKIFCATIPFARNLIEYTEGKKDDYLKLTSLLHWMEDTRNIFVDDYLKIYNRIFGTTFNSSDTRFTTNLPVIDLLFSEADFMCDSCMHESLNLEDKVLLSMAIRLKAEIFLVNRISSIDSEIISRCRLNGKFGKLVDKFEELVPSDPAVHTLEKVSITVSSNIHLNSFMYEPILDLSIDHLIRLYLDVKKLHSTVKT